MAQVIFSRKTTSEINELPIVDGQLIWNIETGETYIDIGTERIATGGSGNDGKSAYEIWLEQGNIGTEQEFLDSLKASGTGEGTESNSGLSTKAINLLVSILDEAIYGKNQSANIQELYNELIKTESKPSGDYDYVLLNGNLIINKVKKVHLSNQNLEIL